MHRCQILTGTGPCKEDAEFRAFDGSVLVSVCSEHLTVIVNRIAKVAPDHAVPVYVLEKENDNA